MNAGACVSFDIGLGLAEADADAEFEHPPTGGVTQTAAGDAKFDDELFAEHGGRSNFAQCSSGCVCCTLNAPFTVGLKLLVAAAAVKMEADEEEFEFEPHNVDVDEAADMAEEDDENSSTDLGRLLECVRFT